MKTLDKIVKLLEQTEALEEDELLIPVMASIPNRFTPNVELQFSGWNIQLKPDGTYSVKDTGGILN